MRLADRVTCVLAAVAIPTSMNATAHAGGFYSPYQSGAAIGTALAGASARSDDASFFFYNPATISALKDSQSYLDVRGFIPRARIKVKHATAPDGTIVTQDGGSGNIAYDAVAPGSVSALRLGKSLTFGIGASAHFASDVEVPNANWGGRFHLLSSRIIGANATAALSVEATSWLSISAGLQLQRMDTRFESAALIPTGPASSIETQAVLKGVDWAAGAVAGILLDAGPETRIGLSWRSQLTHDIEGVAFAALAGIPTEAARYDLKLPQIVSAGIEHRASEQLRLFAEVQWIDWSRFDGFAISFASGRPTELRPIKWQDSWLGAAGLGYRVIPSTEITAGVNYSTAASKDGSGSTLSPDGNKLMAGLGLIHHAEGIGRFTFSYAHVYVEEAPVKAINAAAGTLEGTLDASLNMFAASYALNW